ncbi:unnamed protein product [Coregonus sp. 'balchen']|nr:unnamed protein product [Coregonus sp. 'balchen']
MRFTDLNQAPPVVAPPSLCVDKLKQLLSQLTQDQREAASWRGEVVKVMSQLVQEHREVSSSQGDVIKLLKAMKDYGAQHLSDLRNLARHQSLLVENHQALLLQAPPVVAPPSLCVDKLKQLLSQLTQDQREAASWRGEVVKVMSQLVQEHREVSSSQGDVIKLLKAMKRSPPVIKLNSVVLREAEWTMPVGTSSFTLTCEGNSTVTWSTTAFKLKRSTRLGSVITIRRLTTDYTGTYKCMYENQPDLTSEVHIYVKDPHNILVTPRTLGDVKDGSDVLLCQLTDPSATDLSLRLANGDPTPPDMNYTVNPKRGILIRYLLTSHSAEYVCSAKINGVTIVSKVVPIIVIQRLRSPPSVLIEVDGYVRIVGEQLLIHCITSNPNHFYNVTWKHSSLKALDFSHKMIQEDQSKQVHITSSVTIPAVAMSHTGNFTCTAMNEAGANSSTTYLQVVDKPYIRLIPQLSPDLYLNGSLVEVNEGENLEINIRIEAYPQIKEQWWDMPMSHSHNISTHDDTWAVRYNNRYESILLLQRVRSEERGQYTLHTRSTCLNGSITFNVQVYQKPSAMVRLKNVTTLTCTASGYPAPIILWYQCPGIQNTCDGDNDTMEVQPLLTSTVEVQTEALGPEEVQSELTLSPLSMEVTVECVTVNLVGEERDIFVVRVPAETSSKYVTSKLFTPTLNGATSTAAFLFLLLVIVLYKYKQWDLLLQLKQLRGHASSAEAQTLPYG